ncbi:P-loop containing nucleoside triphosphate hydrolases superfamily protein [Prunus dulcis]|uniref:P-loop containing nucleoside triphosphate hydrolases superfamily protein n=1 Tax=Prunus dulcis TaxID=3755 RepID=A0A4Y1RPT9_PRUDU|nr:P-loop containing nucleoside triphosphate hydrolases superfamily protein [Prunus dulcis]
MVLDIHTKEILGCGTKRGGLYYVDDFSPGVANSVTHPFDSKQKQIWLWHCRLGHPSFSYMKHLIPDLFSGFKDSDFTCDTCILAKSHRVPYPLSTNKCTTPFALIHSDVWGPSPITASSGVRWFVTFIDDCTRMTWLYLLKNKNETYFQQHEIIHETTCPHTSQQNGVAERKNRHLLETAGALLIGAHVPRHQWDDAIVTAVHLINCMPSGVLAEHRPLSSVLVLTPRIFGCVAFVHLHKNQRSKLDPCALRCVFVGYATHQKGYPCYHPSTRRTYVTLDVTFLESELFFHDPSSNSMLQGEIRSEEQNWSNLENEEIPLCTEMIDRPSLEHQITLYRKAINRPFIAINCHPPNRYSPDIGKTSKYPIANHVSTEKLFEPLKAFVHQFSAIHIPTKVSEALKDPKWVQAIKEEMKALEKNQT